MVYKRCANPKRVRPDGKMWNLVSTRMKSYLCIGKHSQIHLGDKISLILHHVRGYLRCKGDHFNTAIFPSPRALCLFQRLVEGQVPHLLHCHPTSWWFQISTETGPVTMYQQRQKPETRRRSNS